MKLAIISFTDMGFLKGEELVDSLKDRFEISHIQYRKLKDENINIIEQLWVENDGLLFISASGIAVRLVAKYLHDKRSDPAVLCMDDTGKFVIPLLSGHIGGANGLALEIAEITGSTPVITTATDNRKIQAPDLFAKDNGYFIENPKELIKVTAMMVNGYKIGFYSDQEQSIDYGNTVFINSLEEDRDLCQAMIIVSNKLHIKSLNKPYILMRPRNINLGIGCRKGVLGENIIKFIYQVLGEAGLSFHSVGKIGTIEVKKKEPGILMAAEHFGCNVRIFTKEEIMGVQDRFPKSEFVRKNIGVYSVSGPSAYLLGGTVIVNKKVKDGITLSVSLEGSRR